MSAMKDLLNKLIGKVNASVKTEAQSLTDELKAQARTNIGAASQSEVEQLSEEIADKVTSPDVAEVGQVIAVKAVDENGKPTEWEAVDLAAGGVKSWNDLTDRPFYKKTKIIEILPYAQMMGADGQFECDFNTSLVDGAVYTVKYNGASYDCTAVMVDGDFVLGNMKVVNGEDTGEPFTVAVSQQFNLLMVIPHDGATEVFFGMSGMIVDIKKMDAELAPCVVFYYGDDSYLYTDRELTEKVTCDTVTKANATGAPIYLTVNGSRLFLALYVSLAITDDSTTYAQIWVTAGHDANKVLKIKEYYTAEYVPPTTE